MKGDKRQTKVTLAVLAGLLVVTGIIVAVVIYIDQVAPARTVVLSVNGRSVTMDYFLKRLRLSGTEPMDMLQALSREQIITEAGARSPFSIDVTSEEIDAYLRSVARGSGDRLDEDEYLEWYRQQMNATGFSDQEFRDLARINLTTIQLARYFTESVPEAGEHVRLLGILLADLEAAEAVTRRLDDGESFGELAARIGADPALVERRGDLGWFTRGTLPASVDDAAFEDLAIGEVSRPLELGEQLILISVVDRETRPIEPTARRMLGEAALDEWLGRRMEEATVSFHGFTNGYDMETDAWVKARLREMSQ